MALILDAIPGRQEVVVKNLGPHLKDIRGVTGATVLGDGRVVLILSLPELLSMPPRTDVRVPTIPALTGAMPRMPASQSSGVTGPIMDPEAIARISTNSLNPAALSRQTTGAPVQIPTSAAQPAVASRPSDFVVMRAEPTAPRGSGSQPAAPGQPARSDVTRAPTGAPTPRAGYVLVVDDSPSVRRVVSNMLKASGWEVQSARDGIEALDVIGRQTPAAVLLDIEMPRMDGYELMATLRSQPQYHTLPLIVLTSRAASKHQQRAVQLGANAYVVKPYQDADLLRQLDELVAAHAAQGR
jgi:CheY-like chemotaxis protein